MKPTFVKVVPLMALEIGWLTVWELTMKSMILVSWTIWCINFSFSSQVKALNSSHLRVRLPLNHIIYVWSFLVYIFCGNIQWDIWANHCTWCMESSMPFPPHCTTHLWEVYYHKLLAFLLHHKLLTLPLFYHFVGSIETAVNNITPPRIPPWTI